MDRPTIAIYTVAGVIVVLAVATGPIGLIQIPDASADFENLGTGNATVEVVSPPDTVTIRPGTSGQNHYYMEVPPIAVRIHNLTGNPHINYYVTIEELQYSANSVKPLQPEGDGRTEIGLERVVFEESDIRQPSYTGEIRLVIHGDGGSRTVYERPITIEVQE